MPANILVADDEPDIELLIKQTFRMEIKNGSHGFRFARDGLEALDTLETHRDIDLVLTDLNMPVMGGLGLLARLRELDRPVEAVVITAYGDMANIRMAMNRGAFDFITKPIDGRDLRITVAKAQAEIERRKQDALVRTALGRYLSDEVVSTLLEHPEALRLGGEKREVTLLMSDLRGFSTLTEGLPPEKVIEILNGYLGRMTDVITSYGGTIDEFIGDGILVIFGAPIQREDDALRAVACAVDMQRAMDDINAEMAARGLPRLEMGIGIHTGEVVVGNIGSLKRAKYGVVGSHVNLTARIESYTVGGQVLTTESTLLAAGPPVLIGREILVSTKGFSAPISIYEIEGVGRPYDVSLPVWVEQLTELERPWSIRYSVLDGKHLTEAFDRGEIVRLSSCGALIRTDRHVDVLSNLKIVLPHPDGDIGDLYAKVVEDAEGSNVEIRFTAVPEEVAAAIRRVVSDGQ